METMRRFLVPTPVALGVGAVTFLILYGVAGAGSVRLLEIGIALLLALVATAVVLAVILVVVGVQVPTWLTFAVGLLVGDRRNRAARDHAVSPTA